MRFQLAARPAPEKPGRSAFCCIKKKTGSSIVMSFFNRYYKILSVCALIALHLQLSGCATYLVLKKTEPQEKIERYDSVYISPENDLILNLGQNKRVSPSLFTQRRQRESRIALVDALSAILVERYSSLSAILYL